MATMYEIYTGSDWGTGGKMKVCNSHFLHCSCVLGIVDSTVKVLMTNDSTRNSFDLLAEYLDESQDL